MHKLEEIINKIGFTTTSKNIKKAFYDKYIRKENFNYTIIYKYPDLIDIYKLHNKINWQTLNNNYNLDNGFFDKYRDYFKFGFLENNNIKRNNKIINKEIQNDNSFKHRTFEEIYGHIIPEVFI